MKIDAHNHFWKYDPVRDDWIDESMKVIRRDYLPHHFNKVLQHNGFDGSVAVQADQSEQETMFLLQHAEKNDFIKGVVGWIDFLADDIEEKLNNYTDYTLLKGFRHIAQSEIKDFLISKKFLRGMKALSATNYTYDILIFPSQLEAAIKLVGKFPNQEFVLDHIAKPNIKSGEIDEWAGLIRKLAIHDNVSCKISGLVTEADWEGWQEIDFYPYLDVVTEAFGTARLMFGSDYPVCLVAARYEQVLQIVENYFSAFSLSERKNIFCNNVSAFYKL